ncbi:MAG TPA: HAD-IA family hydrolase [Polyangiaceae bacterium]|jgi:pseudouridine-5'-monophosphatase|nr:HAD-IA family hydrolase [Polyangiaceae bacterium]
MFDRDFSTPDAQAKTERPLAVIFDLDGTLLDTEPLYTLSAQRVAARFGKSFDWTLKSQTMGGDAEFGAELVVRTLGLPISPAEYLSERYAILRQLFLETSAMPGAESCVRALQSAGVPVAIGTSSYAELCDLKWTNFPWISSIGVKVCGDDPEVKARKPAPDIFLLAARRLGVAPERCVVFEDSPAGVTAAKRAGMRVVVIKARELDAALVAHADRVLNHFDELDYALLGL